MVNHFDRAENLPDLPASFVEVAGSAGIDPERLASAMRACLGDYFARKLTLFNPARGGG